MKIFKLMQAFPSMGTDEHLLTHRALRPLDVIPVNVYIQSELH